MYHQSIDIIFDAAYRPVSHPAGLYTQDAGGRADIPSAFFHIAPLPVQEVILYAGAAGDHQKTSKQH